MGAVASQITSLTIVYSTVYSGADKNITSKLRVTGLCAGSSSVIGEFPAQMASNAENASIWWRHHEIEPPIVLSHISHLILPWLHWARMPGSKRNYPSLDRPVVSRDTKLNNQGILYVCPPSTSDMGQRYQVGFTIIVEDCH